MKYLRNIVRWIDSLEDGSQFQKPVAILLKIAAVLSLIGAIFLGLLILIGSIAEIDSLQTRSGVIAIYGSILVLCVNIVFGAILAMLFWHRSNKVSRLGDESDYKLIPIVVILIRLSGELGFLSLVYSGCQTLLSSIIGLRFPSSLEFMELEFDVHLNEQYSIVTGVITCVNAVIMGVVVLIIQYFAAELIKLLVDLAANVKKNRTTLPNDEDNSDS